MRPRTTNMQRQAFDAYQLSFESAGALGLKRILRVRPHMAPYIAFAAPRLACPCLLL
jgi:hypothetical protein